MNVAALQWRLEGIHNDINGVLAAGKIATTSLVRILAHFLVMPFFFLVQTKCQVVVLQ